MVSKKNIIIRSETAEFLIFEIEKKQSGVEVLFEDGDLWLNQKALGELFETTRNNITMHLQDIYKMYELDENATSKDFLQVQKEGNREVKREIRYYNLDAIISVGFRVNSDRAVQFRRWAINDSVCQYYKDICLLKNSIALSLIFTDSALGLAKKKVRTRFAQTCTFC